MTVDLKTIIGPAAAKKSSADLTTDKERVAAELATTETRLGELQKKRPAILKSCDDAAAENHDREIGAAQRHVDRLGVVLDELEKLIGTAHAREEVARLDRLAIDTEAAVQDALTDLREIYAPAAKKIADFLEKWQRVEGMVRDANEQLRQNGRETIADPEWIARRAPNKVIPGREVEEKYHPAMTWEEDTRSPGTMRPVGNYAHQQAEMRTRVIPEEIVPGRRLDPLTATVNLPPALIGDAPIYSPPH